MDSNYMKAHTMGYLRFQRMCIYCATECGDYSADILGYNGKELIEVEVKVSYSDFLADFKKKKHRAYKRPRFLWVPHRFYFAVPEKIVEKCSLYIKEKKLKYGLISVKENYFIDQQALFYTAIENEVTEIKISAKKLHENMIPGSILQKIVGRMSSELCQRNGELYCKGK